MSTQVYFDEDGRKHVLRARPGKVTAVSNHPDGSHEAQTGSWDHQSTSRSTASGEATHEYKGRPARNESDTLNACDRLMEALVARRGVTPKARFRHPEGPERGIDCTAETEDGDTIDVQVTNAAGPALLREWGKEKAASSSQSGAELADDILGQLEKKRSTCAERDRKDIVLLLDATRSPAHTSPRCIAALREPPRSEYLATTGYREAWIAGATNELTFRLDEPDDGT